MRKEMVTFQSLGLLLFIVLLVAVALGVPRLPWKNYSFLPHGLLMTQIFILPFFTCKNCGGLTTYFKF